jgi:apolipoprotein D and lipocalin family protein
MINLVLLIYSVMMINSEKPQTVNEVNLNQYAGTWYEIALFLNRFEKGCSCTSAEYSLTEKGYVTVTNRCMRGGKQTSITGKAFVVKNSGNAKLKVQFFWPFRGDYWILGLANDYSWALVGSPNRKYLWILARERVLDEKVYDSIVQLAREKGFDTSKLVRTMQDCTH